MGGLAAYGHIKIDVDINNILKIFSAYKKMKISKISSVGL